jgi:hypothetical protein
MSNLLLASLLTLTASLSVTAEADPPVALPRQPPPPAYNRCTIGGWAPVLEIDDKTELSDKLPTGKFQLFQNGTWHHVVWANGELSATSGCLPDPQFATLDSVLDELQHASWKTTRVAVACRAYSATYREFHVAGKLVYTQRMCDGFILDKKSQRALTDALSFVDPLLAP